MSFLHEQFGAEPVPLARMDTMPDAQRMDTFRPIPIVKPHYLPSGSHQPQQQPHVALPIAMPMGTSASPYAMSYASPVGEVPRTAGGLALQVIEHTVHRVNPAKGAKGSAPFPGKVDAEGCPLIDLLNPEGQCVVSNLRYFSVRVGLVGPSGQRIYGLPNNEQLVVNAELLYENGQPVSTGTRSDPEAQVAAEAPLSGKTKVLMSGGEAHLRLRINRLSSRCGLQKFRVRLTAERHCVQADLRLSAVTHPVKCVTKLSNKPAGDTAPVLAPFVVRSTSATVSTEVDSVSFPATPLFSSARNSTDDSPCVIAPPSPARETSASALARTPKRKTQVLRMEDEAAAATEARVDTSWLDDAMAELAAHLGQGDAVVSEWLADESSPAAAAAVIVGEGDGETGAVPHAGAGAAVVMGQVVEGPAHAKRHRPADCMDDLDFFRDQLTAEAAHVPVAVPAAEHQTAPPAVALSTRRRSSAVIVGGESGASADVWSTPPDSPGKARGAAMPSAAAPQIHMQIAAELEQLKLHMADLVASKRIITES